MLVHLLPLTVAVPLLTAAALLPFSKVIPRAIADAAAMLAALFVCVLCALTAASAMHAPIHYWFGGWTPSHGIALGIEFNADAVGAGLAAFAALLVGLAFAFSWWYFDSAGALFQVLMLVFLGAMTGFALTGDIFNLFVFFELMSVAAFALAAYKIEEKSAVAGGINFAVTNCIGAFLVLIGIALLYGRTGALNMLQIGAALAHHAPDDLVIVAFCCLLTGFFVKGAVVPFHFWLDDAHAVAPTPLCVLFSGVMVQLSLYAVARIFWTIFEQPLHAHQARLRLLLVVMGTITALLGGIMAFSQRHIKRMLAFSTISHSGLFICGMATFSALGIAAASVFIIAHGLVKAALFMGSGVLLQQTGSLDAVTLRGRCRRLVPLMLLFLTGGLALAGLPPFGIAAGKTLLDSAARDAHLAWLPVIFGMASGFDGGAVLRVTGSVFLGLGGAGKDEGGDDKAPTPQAENKETKYASPGTPLPMILTAFVALLLALAVGLVPQLFAAVKMAAGAFVHAAAAAPGQEMTLSGTLDNVAVTIGAILLAGAALRYPNFKSFAGPLRVLRLAHSGVFTDYVLWITIGVAVYAAFLVPIGVLK